MKFYNLNNKIFIINYIILIILYFNQNLNNSQLINFSSNLKKKSYIKRSFYLNRI